MNHDISSRARTLIDQEKYTEARELLISTFPNDPQAKQWIAEIDEIIGRPSKKDMHSYSCRRLALILLVVMLLVVAIGTTALVLFS